MTAGVSLRRMISCRRLLALLLLIGVVLLPLQQVLACTDDDAMASDTSEHDDAAGMDACIDAVDGNADDHARDGECCGSACSPGVAADTMVCAAPSIAIGSSPEWLVHERPPFPEIRPPRHTSA